MDASSRQVIECHAPATGARIGEVPAHGPAEVRDAVARARAAQRGWAALSVEARCKQLLELRHHLVERSDNLADLMAQETGKPRQETLLLEIGLLCSLLTYYARKAPELLAVQRRTPMVLKHRKHRVYHQPRGVIGIIAPWNFPLLIPFGDALTALFAGNGVVVKPSEYTPLVALEMKRICDEAGLPPELLQIVPGYGPTGRALIEAGVQKIVFTGGVETGRRVAAACGAALVECVLELGGKAPAIVCSDADLERTARAITFGGFVNNGQACISVERVLVHAQVHDALVERLVHHTRRLRLGGPDGRWDLGPFIYPEQATITDSLVKDAVAQGARVLTGGRRAERPGHFYEPTILVDCTEGMRVMREEVFGPVIPVMRVQSDEEALRVANSLDLGLSASVFSRSAARARAIGERLEVGSVVVNDVLSDYGAAEAPFGGVKSSGYGRIHGPEALRAMCHLKTISEERLPPPTPLWFPYSEHSEGVARKLLRTFFSKKSPLSGFVGRL